ncbi:MAG: peptidyl-prolyl cis-trans isomerase [Burkholderiales bacterium]|nr:peptidyl-prolyl cis-trans isomerase [Burkholderiales bacterium]
MIRKLLREPVLHFLLIGVAIFVAYGALAPATPDASRIVVSQAVVDGMVREFRARWQRTPGDAEIAGLVESYVRDEILYREGVALGLERDDAVIKRRVRQKLEVIAEEQIARDPPTDAELAAYLAANLGRFTRPGTVTFEQVLFAQAATFAEVEVARAAAERGADPMRLGRSSLLPARVDEVPLDLVARDFGSGFASELARLPANIWAGPVRSGLGLHLVRVAALTPPAVPALADVRSKVAREWENERRVASLAQSYRKLRDRYEVVIEATQLASAAAR